jgi:hypothetical protein
VKVLTLIYSLNNPFYHHLFVFVKKNCPLRIKTLLSCLLFSLLFLVDEGHSEEIPMRLNDFLSCLIYSGNLLQSNNLSLSATWGIGRKSDSFGSCQIAVTMMHGAPPLIAATFCFPDFIFETLAVKIYLLTGERFQSFKQIPTIMLVCRELESLELHISVFLT